MMLLIDNYDSFTYNLAHLFGALGVEVRVLRNDELTPHDAEQLGAAHLVVSPGPGRPADAGASIEIIKRLAPRVPTLGVCLGHQAIVEAFGGEVGYAQRAAARQGEPGAARRHRPLHRPAGAVRRRALPLARRDEVPAELVPTAYADDGEVMAVRHRELPIVGVQFHPESVLTPRRPRARAQLPGGAP